jgi:hypothetical protein
VLIGVSSCAYHLSRSSLDRYSRSKEKVCGSVGLLLEWLFCAFKEELTESNAEQISGLRYHHVMPCVVRERTAPRFACFRFDAVRMSRRAKRPSD